VEPVEKTWVVYIIETTQGKLYTGITNDLAKRTHMHKCGRGAKYFRIDPPLRVLWQEAQTSKQIAASREVAIKRLNRQQKLAIVADAAQIPIDI